MTAIIAAAKLTPRLVEKPWGRAILPVPFSNPGSRTIGEIWFEAEAGLSVPLLVKYLFTSQKLSIQVHPSERDALAKGLPGGKEECWLVLNAEPGAKLGIGTQRALTADELRAASLNGDLESLMDWKSVRRGDFFYIPAGTVHAIGAGVSLIEIQQNADITYRLYDYGRPRELHLDDGIAVATAEPYAHTLQKHVDFSVDQMLVDGPLFRVALRGDKGAPVPGSGPLIVVPVHGSVTTQGERACLTVGEGECLVLDPQAAFTTSPGARLLLARTA